MNRNLEIFEIIKQSKNVAIFGHTNPDGDCVGSAMAFANCLTLMGKRAKVFIDDEISENFHFLLNQKFSNQEIDDDFDLVIVVDSSDAKRIGKYADYVCNHSLSICFDHHFGHEKFTNYLVLDDEASSACEVIYYFMEQFEMPFNSAVAMSLYSGLATDTGGFLHSSTTSKVHLIASKLIEFGFDLEIVHYFLFKRKTLPQIELLGCALSNIESYYGGKFNIISLSQEIFKKTRTTDKDVLGLVNFGLNIDNVILCALISETDENSCRISFRTTSDFDANKIARVFGGGGHKRASGCKIFGKLNSVKARIIDEVGKLL